MQWQGRWRKLTRQTYIKNPEYASSQQRLDALHKAVVEGVEAEAILKYADILLKDIERETLEALLRNDTDVEKQQMFYQVAVRFNQLIKNTVSQGKQKEITLASLRK